MKFKTILLTSLMIGLNLYGFEPLNPENAINKFSNDFYQLNDYDSSPWRDYGTKSQPSFICQSSYNAFGDKYFADLYNLIVKENPKLKDKAQNIARERISKTQKECIRYSKKEYDYSFIESKALFVSESISCISKKYRHFTAKLALMLYEYDKELFKRIYGEEYEKFKEVFKDTLSIYDLKFEGISAKQKEENIRLYENFKEKYKDYDIESFGYNHCWDASYVLLTQYSLIDKKGHLVLPEDRKNHDEK